MASTTASRSPGPLGCSALSARNGCSVPNPGRRASWSRIALSSRSRSTASARSRRSYCSSVVGSLLITLQGRRCGDTQDGDDRLAPRPGCPDKAGASRVAHPRSRRAAGAAAATSWRISCLSAASRWMLAAPPSAAPPVVASVSVAEPETPATDCDEDGPRRRQARRVIEERARGGPFAGSTPTPSPQRSAASGASPRRPDPSRGSATALLYGPAESRR